MDLYTHAIQLTMIETIIQLIGSVTSLKKEEERKKRTLCGPTFTGNLRLNCSYTLFVLACYHNNINHV